MPFDIYIVIIATLILLAIISIIKNIKEGVIACIISGGITIIFFLIHYIYITINNFFHKSGISFKNIFLWIIYMALTCLVFLIIIFFIKFTGIKKR